MTLIKTKSTVVNNIFFIIYSIILKITLELSYAEFIVQVFEYEGYKVNYNLVKYLESWIIYMMLIIGTPKALRKPSDFLLAFLVFVFLTPLLVFYGMSGADRSTLYTILMSVCLIYIFRLGPVIQLRNLRGGVVFAYGLIFLGIFTVTAWMVLSGGVNSFNLDLTLVYEFRDAAGESIDKGVMSYINVWASKVFGPALLALALWRKRYFLASVVIGMHIFWFGVSSHKSIIIYPFLIIFIWFWFENAKDLSLIPFSLVILVSSLLMYYYITNEIFIGSMFIRRAFFVPAKLTFDYYEFFSTNPFIYWSNSFASPFIEYPYTTNTALLIGSYLGNDTTAANNSFLSTGYMHAGIFGMFIYGVLVGLLFKLIDDLSRYRMPVWMALSLIIIPSLALLTSADLPTSLLTHGFAMSIVLIFMLGSPSYFKMKER